MMSECVGAGVIADIRTATTTPAAGANAVRSKSVIGNCVIGLDSSADSPSPNRDSSSLDDVIMGEPSRIHSVTHGEASAYTKSYRSSGLLGSNLCRVLFRRLILPIVDAHHAGITMPCPG